MPCFSQISFRENLGFFPSSLAFCSTSLILSMQAFISSAVKRPIHLLAWAESPRSFFPSLVCRLGDVFFFFLSESGHIRVRPILKSNDWDKTKHKRHGEWWGGVSETQVTWGRGRVTATQVTWGSKTVYNKKKYKENVWI